MNTGLGASVLNLKYSSWLQPISQILDSREILAEDKHSSLFSPAVSDEQKKFLYINSRNQYYKTFCEVIFTFE